MGRTAIIQTLPTLISIQIMEMSSIDSEENLREAACLGNIGDVEQLLKNGVNVNSQNRMNGWTALHWAAARNHKDMVQLLLWKGASPSIPNNKGETPASVTVSPEIKQMLGSSAVTLNTRAELPITPSYLKYPAVTKCQTCQKASEINSLDTLSCISNYNKVKSEESHDKLILKVRIANSVETDFIEIELNQSDLTMEQLLTACYEEFGLKNDAIAKIRKLPNTIIRKDNDVKRLKDYQEIELCLKQKAPIRVNFF